MLSDYQKSKYTRAEIDAYLGRARGVSNPWLNDNGVFLPWCLVDQRQGYVVPPATPTYDSIGGAQVGTTDNYYTVVRDAVSLSWGAVSIGGSTYYVEWAYAVRGYTGAGYGLDRWLSHEATNTTLIYDDHITITRQHAQIIDNYAKLVGKQVTISALTELGLFTATGVCTNNDGVQVSYNDGNGHDIVLYNNGSYHGFQINNTNGGTLGLYGAKIELGPEQTLAHQDENGVWQLNELPNYADTLERCKRFYQRITSNGLIAIKHASYNDKFIIIKSFDVEMADTPKVRLLKPITVFSPLHASLVNGSAIGGYVTNKKGIQYAYLTSENDLASYSAGFLGYGDNNDDVIEVYVEGLGG